MIQKQFAALSLTLWKKIREDGCQLDFFIAIDKHARVPPQVPPPMPTSRRVHSCVRFE
jgi:hypothetical protein